MKQLTRNEIDILSAYIYVSIHSIERSVKVLIDQLEPYVMTQAEFAYFVRKKGIVEARRQSQMKADNFVLGSNDKNLREWLTAAKQLYQATAKCTTAGIMNTTTCGDPSDSFTALLNDSQWLVRLFLLQVNVHPDDYIKVESAIKLLWDKTNQPVTTDLINLFRPQI